MRKRRAFATLFSVALVALAGMAILAMTLRFSTAARQTRAAHEDAQLKQLLIAATRAAQANQDRITPPVELSDAKVTIRNDAGQSEIEASLGKRRMTQVVEFDEQRTIKRVIVK